MNTQLPTMTPRELSDTYLNYFKNTAGVQNVVVTEVSRADSLRPTVHVAFYFEGGKMIEVFNKIDTIAKALGNAEANAKPLAAMQTLREFLTS